MSFHAINKAKVHLPLVSDLCPDLLPNRQGLRLFQLLRSVSTRVLGMRMAKNFSILDPAAWSEQPVFTPQSGL